MLVLSRRPSESITLDGGVEITVLAVHGDKVRLGLVAPDDTKIWRTELTRAIQPPVLSDCNAHD